MYIIGALKGAHEVGVLSRLSRLTEVGESHSSWRTTWRRGGSFAKNLRQARFGRPGFAQRAIDCSRLAVDEDSMKCVETVWGLLSMGDAPQWQESL
jgi:hypothetical protein